MLARLEALESDLVKVGKRGLVVQVAAWCVPWRAKGANDVRREAPRLIPRRLPPQMQLQAMILLHDQQLMTLPRYPGSGGAEDPGGGGGGGAGQGSLPYPAAPLALGNM